MVSSGKFKQHGHANPSHAAAELVDELAWKANLASQPVSLQACVNVGSCTDIQDSRTSAILRYRKPERIEPGQEAKALILDLLPLHVIHTSR